MKISFISIIAFTVFTLISFVTAEEVKQSTNIEEKIAKTVGLGYFTYDEEESFIEGAVKETIWSVAVEGVLKFFGMSFGTGNQIVKTSINEITKSNIIEQSEEKVVNDFWDMVYEAKLVNNYPSICKLAEKHEIDSPPFCKEVEKSETTILENIKHIVHHDYDPDCSLCWEDKLELELKNIKEEKKNNYPCQQSNIDCNLNNNDLKKAISQLLLLNRAD